MGLHDTTKHMRELLAAISVDLEKSSGGNKAAAQRVRTGTIKLEKIAKSFRKESINAEKSGSFPKRPSQKKAAKAQKKQAVKAKPKAKAVCGRMCRR
jgi:hypothetical protein